MKKLLLLAIILCFTSKNYSLNEEWLNYFDQSNFEECLKKLHLIESSKEDTTLALEKIDEAMKNMEQGYIPIFGKTIKQDSLIVDLVPLLGSIMVEIGIFSLIVNYLERNKIKSAQQSIDNNNDNITALQPGNNPFQIHRLMRNNDNLSHSYIPMFKRMCSFTAKIALPSLTIGTLLLGYMIKIFSKKHLESRKTLKKWMQLKNLRNSLR